MWILGRALFLVLASGIDAFVESDGRPRNQSQIAINADVLSFTGEMEFINAMHTISSGMSRVEKRKRMKLNNVQHRLKYVYASYLGSSNCMTKWQVRAFAVSLSSPAPHSRILCPVARQENLTLLGCSLHQCLARKAMCFGQFVEKRALAASPQVARKFQVDKAGSDRRARARRSGRRCRCSSAHY